jgi:predicted nuclease with TOPRIM domain
MKAYTTDEWLGMKSSPTQKPGVMLVQDPDKEVNQGGPHVHMFFLLKDDAIKLADEIYEKLGLTANTLLGMVHEKAAEIASLKEKLGSSEVDIRDMHSAARLMNDKVNTLQKQLEETQLLGCRGSDTIVDLRKECNFLKARIVEMADSLRNVVREAGKVL